MKHSLIISILLVLGSIFSLYYIAPVLLAVLVGATLFTCFAGTMAYVIFNHVNENKLKTRSMSVAITHIYDDYYVVNCKRIDMRTEKVLITAEDEQYWDDFEVGLSDNELRAVTDFKQRLEEGKKIQSSIQ